MNADRAMTDATAASNRGLQLLVLLAQRDEANGRRELISSVSSMAGQHSLVRVSPLLRRSSEHRTAP